ncbi:FeoB-associated Cys-rich membrane protein [Fulvivirga kasyanovii]|uniref:FeoB-associated Cys-rich membrane protein n=1 Tax=Fulvivirga kasyanovii TaxID=396812 RepID=A0ABW9RLN4_9BACT|nr:FeoB-associated Cys-rich membrane protein [Fulvivirga kasyanovii]MTI24999.1 FeoB-associated Cys-rich membrane protein [Fulvivirga kasyanovii]
MQEAIIIILFLSALAYLGNIVYKQTKADTGCSKNCGCDSPVSNLKKVKNR